MPHSSTSHRTAFLLVAFATLLMLAVGAAVLAGPSDAKNRNSKVLGATKKTPKPLCQGKKGQCFVTGSVTGFGVSAEGKKGLYRIPANGHIVAWSVDLADPEQFAIDSFNEKFEDKKFGQDSVAKLAILKKKKTKDKKKSRYALAKQTPTVPLVPQFGHKPIFTLGKPLKVKKGQVAALTLPTWAPLYTNHVSTAGNSWKASRPSDDCGLDGVLAAKPHLRKGTTRTYGCTLTGERDPLLGLLRPGRQEVANQAAGALWAPGPEPTRRTAGWRRTRPRRRPRASRPRACCRSSRCPGPSCRS